MSNKNKVFISYSSKDIAYANGMTGILKELGVTYWKAPEMIPAGSNYAREIPKAIQECRYFLLLISKASQSSIWVEKELDMAINHRKHIIPIRVDKEPLNDMYQFYLNNVQMISYGLDKVKLLEVLREQFGDLVISVPVREEGSGEREAVKRRNLFTPNKAPEECWYCKGILRETAKGVYTCNNCGRESYDYYQTVKRYLQENGAATAVDIERETGVPRRVVSYFLREEYLEIPSLDANRIICQKCGARIRSGILCERCKMH